MNRASLLIPIVALVPLNWVAAPADAKSNMDRIREKAEEFTAKLLEVDYETRVEGKKAKYERVHSDFEYLFSTSKISDINDEIPDASETEQRALELLRSFIETRLVSNTVAPLMDALDETRNEAPEEGIPGYDKVSIDKVATIARHASERKARRFAHLLLCDKNQIYNVFLNQMISATESQIKELGYTSYPAYRAAQQDIDYATLQAFCEGWIADTAAEYTAALEKLAADAGVKMSRLAFYDLHHFAGSPGFDDALEKVKGEDVWKRLAQGLKLPAADKAFKTRWSEGKRGVVAEVFPVSFAKEIRVYGQPFGAAHNLHAWLRNFGAAQRALALRDQDQWEFARIAQGAHTWAAAFLFEGLVGDPAFATAALGLDEATAAKLAETRRAAELVGLRLDAATFLYGLKLYEDFKLGQPKFADAIQSTLALELKRIDSELYLADYQLESAERLAGRLLATQLRGVLHAKFGATWWSSGEAGAYLKALWAQGSAQSTAALAQGQGFTLFDRERVAELLSAAK